MKIIALTFFFNIKAQRIFKIMKVTSDNNIKIPLRTTSNTFILLNEQFLSETHTNSKLKHFFSFSTFFTIVTTASMVVECRLLSFKVWHKQHNINFQRHIARINEIRWTTFVLFFTYFSFKWTFHSSRCYLKTQEKQWNRIKVFLIKRIS